MQNLERWSPSLTPYAEWLAAENPGAATVWANNLRSDEEAVSEGAIAEAVAWDYLKHRVDRIRSAETSDSKPSPDFLCEVDGQEFYVEVTNISRSRVGELTSLSDEVDLEVRGPQNYGDWSAHVKREIIAKARQGADLDMPYVVMVSTLHKQASALLCRRPHVENILHSRTFLRGFIDDEGEPVGDIQHVADLKHAAFTQKNSTEPARRHVSGALVAGFGAYPDAAHVDAHVLGVLHQDAARPFDPSLLSGIPFCRFETWPPEGVLDVEWVGPPEPRKMTEEEWFRRNRDKL